MSVKSYIAEFNKAIQNRIQENKEKLDSNPYPLDELNALKANEPDSAIALLYDENGESGNAALREPAAAQNPDLYKRLQRGARYMDRLKKSEELVNLDPRSVLNRSYNAFVSGLSNAGALGSDLSIEQVLKSNPGEFSEIYDEFSDDVIHISPSILQSAFNEIKSSGSPVNEAESAAINNTEEGSAAIGEIEEEQAAEPTEEIPADIGVASEPVTIPEENAVEIPATGVPVNEEPTVESTEVVSDVTPVTNIVTNEETNVTNATENTNQSITSPINQENETKKKGKGLKDILNKVKEKTDELTNVSNVNDIVNVFKKGNINEESSSTAINTFNESNTSSPVESGITNIDKTSIFGAPNLNENVDDSDAVLVESNNVTSTSKESSSLQKVSELSAPNITKLGPEAEPITNETIQNLGNTITSVVQAPAQDEVRSIEKGGELSAPKKKSLSGGKKREDEKGGDPIIMQSNADMIAAINGLKKEMSSIKSLLQGPLDVKIKNR